MWRERLKHACCIACRHSDGVTSLSHCLLAHPVVGSVLGKAHAGCVLHGVSGAAARLSHSTPDASGPKTVSAASAQKQLEDQVLMHCIPLGISSFLCRGVCRGRNQTTENLGVKHVVCTSETRT